MKLNQPIIQRIAGIVISLAFVVLCVFNFINALENEVVWKMIFSVIGFSGFMWMACIAFFQILKLRKNKEV